MAQIFRPSANFIARASIGLLLVTVVALLGAALELQRSPWVSAQGETRVQPVPFSHQHHVAGLGIDCRYCHTSVEVSGFAGIPPTNTCMNCHKQIWNTAPMLEPVRESFRSGRPLQWVRVNDLPDFVYFNHSIHIAKGVGCDTCHGPVGRMPLTYQAQSLQMEWCLSCHRAPENFLRPKSEVFSVEYQQPSSDHVVEIGGQRFDNQLALGTYLKQAYKVRSVRTITDCNTCHR